LFIDQAINILDMRYGILSDIHGNLEALQAVVDRCKKEGVEGFLCLGDIVGYGANPRECLDMIRQLKAVSVAGNHDWAVSGRLDPVYFNWTAKAAVVWTKKQISSDDIAFLKSLEPVFKNGEVILTHGTLNEPERFHYMAYMLQAEETFRLMDRSVCFIGHTHAPQIIIEQDETSRRSDTLKVTIDPESKYIINAGSVGQPRDGNAMAAYCMYDTDTRLVEVKRAPYDIKTAQEKILKAGLPASLAQRLSVGH